MDVTLQTHGTDKYERTLADVLLPDATQVNHALVKDGWCWWYHKYASTQLKHHSNSFHPLKRLPKMRVRLVVVTKMSPCSLSRRVMCSWMPSACEEKSPSREAKPTSRS